MDVRDEAVSHVHCCHHRRRRRSFCFGGTFSRSWLLEVIIEEAIITR